MTVSGPSRGAAERETDLAPTAPIFELPLLADRYQLVEVIGRGGMAEVYRATDVKLRRPVAVKILLDGAGDGTDRERFIAEARTLAMLSHSGLVTVLDAGFGTGAPPDEPAATRRNCPFLVMELVDGPTLARVIESGPITLDELGRIAVQIADALTYVHQRGVVHRDVKPGNVLLGRDDTVKLADFGIARLVEEHTRHTRSGLAIGTAAYIAPEQVSGGEVGVAADLYSLGLVLLEAIKGDREYAGPPAEAALARLQRSPEIPSLPPAWHDLLARMTALDPAERPAAADVATALRANLAQPAPTATVGIPDAETSPILGDAADAANAAEGSVGSTKPMTSPVAPPVQPSQPASIVRTGAAASRQVGQLAKQVRSVSTDAWGVVAAAGVFLVMLVVMAVVRGDDASPVVPDNTPADLREPLTELHVAINGEDE